MTSNLGSEALLGGHAGSQAAREGVLRMARQHFRPEFLNRLDDIVVFQPLQPQQLRDVARMQAGEIGARLTGRGISLEVSDAALDYAVAQVCLACCCKMHVSTSGLHAVDFRFECAVIEYCVACLMCCYAWWWW